jgi:hypothetical protein
MMNVKGIAQQNILALDVKNDVSLTCLIIIITPYVKLSEKMGVNVMFVMDMVHVIMVNVNVMTIGLMTAYVNVLIHVHLRMVQHVAVMACVNYMVVLRGAYVK